MRAKKSLGQHFLVEESIAAKVSNSIKDIQGVNQILEVGPGKGMLTQYLDQKEQTLWMVETDKDMIPILHERFPNLKSHLIHADFLRWKLAAHFTEPLILTGNFPYNISSQIVFKMLENKSLIPQMVGMFQKEVGKRIAAGPGSKTYGILSVLVQSFYQVEYLFDVAPGCFQPPPKVVSGVLRVTRKEQIMIEPHLEKLLFQVVKMAFNQRRKMIRNSLKSILPTAFPPEHSMLTLRPEQIRVEDFINLTSEISEAQQISE